VIVADASAITELLLARPAADRIRAVLAGQTELHVPEHFQVEVLSALRRYSLRGELGERRGAEALAAVADLRAVSYPVIELADDIWEMRRELSAYDAAYLALAIRLDAGLLTLDRGLAEAANRRGRRIAI
jgi:predicted nucleic acid-binding protein